MYFFSTTKVIITFCPWLYSSPNILQPKFKWDIIYIEMDQVCLANILNFSFCGSFKDANSLTFFFWEMSRV